VGRTGGRFKSKVRKRETVTKDEEKAMLDPGWARMISFVWWGGGHMYNGLTTKGITVSILQIILILGLVWPMSGFWLEEDVDLIGTLVSRLESLDLGYAFNEHVVGTLETVESSSFNLWLKEDSKDNLGKLLMGLSGFVYLVCLVRVPSEVYQYAILRNLTGKVVEVRRDLSIKINLGEERGVRVGQIFAVQKRKHMDEVYALNFKTMVMAPKMFTIGEAKIISVTQHFGICKFRRLPGETSNPSVGDRVVLRVNV
jgi:hypothetical protein